MRIFDIINKKKNKQELTQKEIEFAVAGYQTGTFGDGEMAALLMAICLNGLNQEETAHLTMAMANSGEILDLSDFGVAVDKHSTGGVGDKLTLTVAPMVAAAGLVMAKMSGKSLGHTGGTIDKLAALPGFKTELEPNEFRSILKDVGVAIASQSPNLAPADKLIYALRDKTACVDNISLIAASVMSKKIAAGAKVIVLDIKVGSGAFMKSLDEARELAQIMVGIGKACGKCVAAVLTKMDAPLGRAVGNGVEVVEAVEVLKGAGNAEIRELSIELAAQIISLAQNKDLALAKGIAARTLDDGTALKKFEEMVQSQGGNVAHVHDSSLFGMCQNIIPFTALQTGYIAEINGEICGHTAYIATKGNTDLQAGIMFEKKPGDKVQIGDTLAYIHANDKNAANEAKSLLQTAYKFSEDKPETASLVYEVIS